MQRIFTIILLIIGFSQSFAQDNRIQEPIKNFDKLWTEFNDRYVNFELNNIDWNNVYTKYRPLIDEKTTNDSLFSVCSKMLLELKDNHVSLVQYGKNSTVIRESEWNPSSFIKMFPMTKKVEPNIYQLFEIRDATLLKNGFSKLITIKSKYGTIAYSSSKQYGYLQILDMMSIPMKKCKKFIDEAIETFDNKKGVLIDIRLNTGGYDYISYAIASRFTDKKRIGHYQRERIKGTSAFKKIETKYLMPDGKKQFTKPIVILTSDFTVSAADVFAMIMKELPYVTLIGDHTLGAFSSVDEFKLPNKWEVNLSNEQYFSADMKNYEGIGIEPDIKMLNKIEDIENGIDPLIENAIEVLNKKNR